MKMKVLLGLLILFSFPFASATTVIYQNFNQLVESSDHVVSGIVKSVKSARYRDNEIYTVVTLSEASTVEANGLVALTSDAKIRIKGGEVELRGKNGAVLGTAGVYSHGTPELHQGERVILFVKNNGVADMPINGWEQGVFRVNKNGVVADAQDHPVFGIVNNNLVTKSSAGFISKGKFISNQTRQRSASAQQKAKIVNSDGGVDTVNDSGALLTRAVQSMQNQAAMNQSQFVAKIQQRKIIASRNAGQLNTQSAAGSFTTDRSSLIKLSAVKQNNLDSAIGSATSSSVKAIDSAQVTTPSNQPLAEPAKQPNTK